MDYETLEEVQQDLRNRRMDLRRLMSMPWEISLSCEEVDELQEEISDLEKLERKFKRARRREEEKK